MTKYYTRKSTTIDISIRSFGDVDGWMGGLFSVKTRRIVEEWDFAPPKPHKPSGSNMEREEPLVSGSRIPSPKGTTTMAQASRGWRWLAPSSSLSTRAWRCTDPTVTWVPSPSSGSRTSTCCLSSTACGCMRVHLRSRPAVNISRWQYGCSPPCSPWCFPTRSPQLCRCLSSYLSGPWLLLLGTPGSGCSSVIGTKQGMDGERYYSLLLSAVI